jgi:hypothetical protein
MPEQTAFHIIRMANVMPTVFFTLQDINEIYISFCRRAASRSAGQASALGSPPQRGVPLCGICLPRRMMGRPFPGLENQLTIPILIVNGLARICIHKVMLDTREEVCNNVGLKNIIRKNVHTKKGCEMAILIIGGSILVGFVLGYFLAIPVLIAITLICIALVVYSNWKHQEIAKVITLFIVVISVIGNASMWITFYFASHQHWVGDFFQRYIFR